MEPVLVVWWVGLIGALIPTLLILKQVALVLRTLRDIRQLAGRTAEAAYGIAAHVEPVPALAAAAASAEPVVHAAGGLRGAAEAVEQSIATCLGPSRLERVSGRLSAWMRRSHSEH